MDSLLGAAAPEWWRLLGENQFAVESKYWKRALIITARSTATSLQARAENRRYGDALAAVNIEAPVFIIGHWRSGTTLLHNLLTQDEKVAYPNLYEVSNPHIFLHTEDRVAERVARKPASSRPMDNVKITMFSPGEEEFALSAMTLLSPIVAWSFPRREEYYDRYLTFADVPPAEIERWMAALKTFMKKLTLRYGKRLVMKSPTHTARLGLLLEMFPDARFVHISRNPYRVYKSTRRLYETAVPPCYLQDPDPEKQNDGIIRRYRMMYEAYFEQRTRIPAGQLCEIRLEDLEQDMVGQVARIYDQLQLDGFSQMEPALCRYVDSLSSYKKNQYDTLPHAVRSRVEQAWQPSFEAWGYSS